MNAEYSERGVLMCIISSFRTVLTCAFRSHNVSDCNNTPFSCLFTCTHDFTFSVFLRSRQSLKVREHKVLGPYVDGLSQLAVTSFEVCLSHVCHYVATSDDTEFPLSL